jgi:hypothetical protein
VAVAALLGLAGCGSSGTGAGTASASGTGTSSTAATGTATATAATAASAGLSKPSTALSLWVANVVEGRFGAACADMVATSSSTPSAGAAPAAPTAASCANLSRTIVDGQSVQSVLARLQPLFTPGSAAAASAASENVDVEVPPVAATGRTATIDARQITVDGQRLDKIVASHSTGVSADQLDLSFPVDDIGGSWYVANFNLNLG